MEFFRSVQSGNIDTVRKLFKPLNSEDLGILSDDGLLNLKYHLIITVSFITRYCIEGGMEMEAAYNLSDIYVRSIDKCRTTDEINILHNELVEDYTQRMSLKKLAEVANLSPAYLSKLFHQEIGMTVSDYITRRRIVEAENMLRFSAHSCIDISNYLCFSSESHFIQVFKKYTGYTPKVFREKFFRKRSG